MPTHFSLFSGIGGIDLAAEWAGFTTAGQCESDDYPTKVLEKHWPDVPRWRDVRDVTGNSFRERTGLRTVTLISGGFPCQPWSLAGERRGVEDDRHLWPEMLRVIKELRPTWVVGENVAGFVSMGLDGALSDLEAEGYEARAFILPACAVGAPHERRRVFIVAHANGKLGETRNGIYTEHKWQIQRDSETKRFPCFREISIARKSGNDDGVRSRVDRLKCLGNAVVPQQVYPILRAITDIGHNIREAALQTSK